MAFDASDVIEKYFSQNMPPFQALVLRLRLRAIAKGAPLTREEVIDETTHTLYPLPDPILATFVLMVAQRIPTADESDAKVLIDVALGLIRAIEADEDKRRALRVLMWYLDGAYSLSESEKVRLVREVVEITRSMGDFEASEVLVTAVYTSARMSERAAVSLLEEILRRTEELPDESRAKVLTAAIKALRQRGLLSRLKERVRSLIEQMSEEKLKSGLLKLLEGDGREVQAV